MKSFSPIGSIRPYPSGSSESGPSRSPTQAQQGESHNVETLSGDSPTGSRKRVRTEGEQRNWDSLPHDLKLTIAKRLRMDRTAQANLRLTSPAFKAAVSEAVTHVKVRNRKDLLAAINAYKAGGITSIDLSYSNITNRDLLLLKDLPGLKQLNLSGCRKLTDAGIAHLQHITSLKQLDLSMCDNLTDVGIAHLQYLTSLQQLNLSGCENITDAGIAHLKNLTSLQRLELIDCSRLTGAKFDHLKDLISLQQLILNYCNNLTDDGIAKLKDITSLRKLELSGCSKLTNQQVNDLRKQLKNCNITRLV